MHASPSEIAHLFVSVRTPLVPGKSLLKFHCHCLNMLEKVYSREINLGLRCRRYVWITIQWVSCHGPDIRFWYILRRNPQNVPRFLNHTFRQQLGGFKRLPSSRGNGSSAIAIYFLYPSLLAWEKS